jgi:hypothetical protein
LALTERDYTIGLNAAKLFRSPIPIAPGQMAVLNYRRADHPFRCRPSDMPIVEVLLTMGQLN